MNMQTVLIISQTVFYILFSLIILVLGVLGSVVAYNIIKITKQLKAISKNIQNTSEKLAERIEDILLRIEKIPFLSYFIKSRHK